ncbi:MAG: UDP-N-acetylmuramoyl-tripeptide--D-alanyl-D-alanine ligase [Treponema sp.]|nr:UDP-N-acetylmuramoyl-tripeptide--D-alanyl-D-alanine ligase [Treponema sp.]
MISSLLTKENLVKAVKGSVIGQFSGQISFVDVQTDSRKIDENLPAMFVPLMGEFQNGHKYIPDVLKKKVSVVLINKAEYQANVDLYEKMAEENQKVLFIAVENTLTALQDAAEEYVSEVCKNMIKISITGSCGKTTTKEMMVSVCKEYFGQENVAYTKGNLNSETGLPLSVFKIKGSEKVGVFEMGMSRKNEIGEISKVYKSKYGIITNIGSAHIGILGSRQNIAEEKRKSLDYIPQDGAAFVGADDDFCDFCCEKVKGKVVKFGPNLDEKESKVAFVKDNGLFGTTFTLEGLQVNLPIGGSYNYHNALAVIACAREIGIPAEKIKAGLEKFAAVSGRMEVGRKIVKGKKVTVINDSYNANPDSMKKSIELCAELKDVNQKIFVLGDMKELGQESVKAHENIGKLLSKIDASYIFLIGPEMENAFTSYDGNSILEWNKDKSSEIYTEISIKIKSIIKENDVILFKASNSMNLKEIIEDITCEEGK